jgi:Tol biopolymer transport system component
MNEEQKVTFDSIKAKHEALSQQARDTTGDSEAFLEQVKAFLREIRQAGREIHPGSGRDLLISLASFWATYYFQHSEDGTYPPTDLDPYMGPPEEITQTSMQSPLQSYISSAEGALIGEMAKSSTTVTTAGSLVDSTWEKIKSLPKHWRYAIFAAPGILILIILLAVFMAGRGTIIPPQASNTEFTETARALVGTQFALMTSQAQVEQIDRTQQAATQLAGASTQPASPTVIVASTPTLVASPTPLPATDTPEPSDTPTPTATPAAGIEGLGVTVLINNLNDLQSVQPVMTLNISYANFSPGWSIHLLLQPLSQGLKYYPLEEFFLVPEGETSGTWTPTVSFGTGAQLANREQYTITPVMALDERARQELSSAVIDGLDVLPKSVYTSPQLVTKVYTVIRGAYNVVNEVRLIYSVYIPDQKNNDLYAALPDGSDPLRLTNSSDISEFHPSLSPSGKQIAFVGRKYSDGSNRVYSLWLMDSNGENRIPIADDPAYIYDTPAWSPDGTSILYSFHPADTSQAKLEDYGINLYDIASGEIVKLKIGLAYSEQPVWMPDGQAFIFVAYSPNTETRGLFRYDIRTGEVTGVFDDKELNESQPAVSPDGRRVVFIDSYTFLFYILDLERGDVFQLITPPVSYQSFPTWGTDNNTIYFEVYQESAYAIMAINADSTDLRPITTTGSALNPTIGLLDVYLPVEAQTSTTGGG